VEAHLAAIAMQTLDKNSENAISASFRPLERNAATT
jgi:hypothetical protein